MGGNLHSGSGAKLLTNIGNVRMMLKDDVGAAKAYSRAVDMYESMGMLEGLHGGQLLLDVAMAAYNQRDAQKAFDFGERAVAIFEQVGHPALLGQAKQVVEVARSHLQPP